MDSFDPERFRAKPRATRPAPKQPRLPKPVPGEKYLAGPVPLPWLARAARLPGQSLQVALVLWHQVQVRRAAIRPSRELLASFGVSPDAATRAYAELERAGLICVVREKGKAPTITIRDIAGGEEMP